MFRNQVGHLRWDFTITGCLRVGAGRVKTVLRWTETTDVSFIMRESSASDTPFAPTTARVDTLAEEMRHVVVIDARTLVFPIDEIDFSELR
jgi:hypothetical protein